MSSAPHCSALSLAATSKTSDLFLSLWDLVCLILFVASWDHFQQVCFKPELFAMLAFVIEVLCGAVYFTVFAHLLGEFIGILSSLSY